MTAKEVYAQLTEWAATHAAEFAALLQKDEAYTLQALSIGRECAKPRKDITVWSDAEDYLSFFYDERFAPDYTLPEHVDVATAKALLTRYEEMYDPADDSDAWFAKVKQLAASIGFADNMKD